MVRLVLPVALLAACSTKDPAVPDPDFGPHLISPAQAAVGRLTGPEGVRRLEAFRSAWEADHDDGGAGYRVFREFLPELGVARIGQFLEGRDRSCHWEAHELGIVIRETAGDLGTAMALCGDTCTYGCVHGVFKVHFSEAVPHASGPPTLEAARAAVGDVCREDSVVVPDFFRGNCAHGIGHAFAGIAFPDAAEATGFCAVFAEPEMRYYCETGVFMELKHAIRVGLDRRARDGHDFVEDAVASCAGGGRFASACLRFVLREPRELADIERLGRACAAQSGPARRGCFNALGFVSRAYVSRRPDRIDAVCAAGDETDRRLCVSGLAFMKKGHRRGALIADACGLFTNRDLRDLCRDQESRDYYRIGNPALAAMLSD